MIHLKYFLTGVKQIGLLLLFVGAIFAPLALAIELTNAWLLIPYLALPLYAIYMIGKVTVEKDRE